MFETKAYAKIQIAIVHFAAHQEHFNFKFWKLDTTKTKNSLKWFKKENVSQAVTQMRSNWVQNQSEKFSKQASRRFSFQSFKNNYNLNVLSELNLIDLRIL